MLKPYQKNKHHCKWQSHTHTHTQNVTAPGVHWQHKTQLYQGGFW